MVRPLSVVWSEEQLVALHGHEVEELDSSEVSDNGVLDLILRKHLDSHGDVIGIQAGDRGGLLLLSVNYVEFFVVETADKEFSDLVLYEVCHVLALQILL